MTSTCAATSARWRRWPSTPLSRSACTTPSASGAGARSAPPWTSCWRATGSTTACTTRRGSPMGGFFVGGGRNIGDEYFDAASQFNFRDLDLVVEGEAAVAQGIAHFERYWRSSRVQPIEHLTAAAARRHNDPQATRRPRRAASAARCRGRQAAGVRLPRPVGSGPGPGRAAGRGPPAGGALRPRPDRRRSAAQGPRAPPRAGPARRDPGRHRRRPERGGGGLALLRARAGAARGC